MTALVKGRSLSLLIVAASISIITLPTTCFGLEEQLKKFVFNNNGLGTYSFEYETQDGTFRREDGGIVQGSHGDSLVMRGEYGYIDPRGRRFALRYVADENGFQPQIQDDTRFNDRRIIHLSLIKPGDAVIYTYEDVELRRIFPSEFPQDTIRKSGSIDPEHLGRYVELEHYFKYPKSKLNSHFEEMACYEDDGKKLCKLDLNRYSFDEDAYYMSSQPASNVDRRRVYCLLLICFTEDELDRVVASFF